MASRAIGVYSPKSELFCLIPFIREILLVFSQQNPQVHYDTILLMSLDII